MTSPLLRQTPDAREMAVPRALPPSPTSGERRLSLGLLTVEQVATELRVPVSWLQSRVASRAVPCTRLGRHVRFTRVQVQAIVASAEQPVLARPVIGLTCRSRRVG